MNTKKDRYTFFFWLIWFLITPLLLKNGWGSAHIAIYYLAGLGIYFVMPLILKAHFNKIKEKEEEHQDKNTTEQNKKLFLKGQHLRKKYRYINLNSKEHIVNSNIIAADDKALLLKFIHGCTLEEISSLLKKTKS